MSLRPDGAYRCDRCGRELANGGVQECAVVSTILGGDLATLHLCREPQKGAPHGCAGHALSPSNLADHRKAAV